MIATPEWPWRPEDFTPDRPATRFAGSSPEEAAALAARCFRGADGAALLAYLKALTLDRALGPDAEDAALRHLEGQRHFVRHICTLIEVGQNGPGAIPTPRTDHEGDDT